MALNIKNSEVERLAAELAGMAKESKTEAIRRALLECKQRLEVRRGDTSRGARLKRLLRQRIWPQLPKDVQGKAISKQEREQILGYGPEGF